MSYRAQEGEVQGGSIQPEDLGIKIAFSSVIAAGIVFTGFVIVTSFLVSVTLRFGDVITTVLVSFLLTFILPGIVYRIAKSRLEGLAEEILEIGNVKNRGENDRGFVLGSLLLAIVGLLAYLWTPAGANQTVRPLSAVQQNLPIFQVVEIIFIDLFTVSAFGIFAGSATAAYYRAKYPRACWHCGDARNLEGEYCPKCGESLSHVPGRFENIKNLLLNDRSYFPQESGEAVQGDIDE